MILLPLFAIYKIATSKHSSSINYAKNYSCVNGLCKNVGSDKGTYYNLFCDGQCSKVPAHTKDYDCVNGICALINGEGRDEGRYYNNTCDGQCYSPAPGPSPTPGPGPTPGTRDYDCESHPFTGLCVNVGTNKGSFTSSDCDNKCANYECVKGICTNTVTGLPAGDSMMCNNKCKIYYCDGGDCARDTIGLCIHSGSADMKCYPDDNTCNKECKPPPTFHCKENGTCEKDPAYCANRQCYDSCKDCPCIPNCKGKVCGDDGCGGPCGNCPPGIECKNGQCK